MGALLAASFSDFITDPCYPGLVQPMVVLALPRRLLIDSLSKPRQQANPGWAVPRLKFPIPRMHQVDSQNQLAHYIHIHGYNLCGDPGGSDRKLKGQSSDTPHLLFLCLLFLCRILNSQQASWSQGSLAGSHRCPGEVSG